MAEQPFQIGQKVRTSAGFNAVYGEWEGVEVWIASISILPNGKGLNIGVTECWPVTSFGDITDGFSVAELEAAL